MKHAYIFPGQGSQFTGMGKNLCDESAAKEMFETANNILGFRISDIMFFGSADALKQTEVTQPAIFLHSVIAFKTLANTAPAMVAGHSLGEFSALVANKCLGFEDALKLVSVRARAMQRACEINPSGMAAVLGLDDAVVEKICDSIEHEIVVAANYNCPGQVVISGSLKAIDDASKLLKEAGAKRTLLLPVGGAFHSPLMQPAKEELSEAIENTEFHVPSCPIYQNVVARAVTDPLEIQMNLILQLTGPVMWTQTILKILEDGATEFTECGPGKVLQGLVQKIYKEAKVNGIG